MVTEPGVEIVYAKWGPPPPADPLLPRRLKRARYEVGLGAALSVLFFVAAARFPAPFGILVIFCLWWLLLAPLFYFTRRRAPFDLSNLADGTESGPYYPVTVILRCGHLTYGGDRGLITFNDGWLVFHGRRVSFSVSSRLVGQFAQTRSKSQKLPTQILTWTLMDKPFSMSIHPFRRLYGQAQVHSLREALDDWKQANVDVSGNAMMPPITPEEGKAGSLRKKIRIVGVLCMISLLATIVASVFCVIHFNWAVFTAAASGLLLFGILWRTRATLPQTQKLWDAMESGALESYLLRTNPRWTWMMQDQFLPVNEAQAN